MSNHIRRNPLSKIRSKKIYTNSETKDDKIYLDTLTGESWIAKIKDDFFKINKNGDGFITFDQWVNSKLKNSIFKEKMSEIQYNEIFRQIDADGDEKISWDELIKYIIYQQRGICESNTDKNLRIINIGPEAAITHKFKSKTIVKKVLYLHADDRIAVLSESLIQFWQLPKVTLFGSFSDNCGFTDFDYMPQLSRLVIAKTNRSLIFFDLKRMEKLPYVITPYISTKRIPTLTQQESMSVLREMERQRKPPLYNMSTAVCAVPGKAIVLVGDDTGKIEVFSRIQQTISDNHWSSQRIYTMTFHSDAITQITYIPSISSYVSSSLDGSLVVWTFDDKDLKYAINFIANDRWDQPITGFIYDTRTSYFVYTTATHYFGFVRLFSKGVKRIETPNQMINCMSIINISSESSFLVTVSKNNLCLIYMLPTFEELNNFYIDNQHLFSPPSGAIYLDGKLYLAGSYVSVWKCESSDSKFFSPHLDIIVGLESNGTLDHAITADSGGELIVWDLKMATKLFTFKCGKEDEKVSSLCSDEFCRRLFIGFNSGRIVVISPNSGELLAELPRNHVDGTCSKITYGELNGSKYVIVVCGSSKITCFEDCVGAGFKHARNFLHHKEIIVDILTIKKSLLLSVGDTSEIFSWTQNAFVPQVMYKCLHHPVCAADLKHTDDLFLVGDSKGCLSMFTIDSPEPLKYIYPFDTRVKFGIKCITSYNNYIYMGNSGGYLTCIKIDDENIGRLWSVRANVDAVEYIKYTPKNNCIITSGSEQDIKVFSEDGKFVGQIGSLKNWNIRKPESWQVVPPYEPEPDDFIEQDSDDIDVIVNKRHIINDKSEQQEPVIYTQENEKLLDDSEDELMLTQPAFTYQQIIPMLSNLDDLYKGGKDVIEIVKQHQGEEKRKEKDRHTSYEKSLEPEREDADLERNIRTMENLIARRKIRRKSVRR